ncbi:MAG TPA: SPOR domain-containing protein [Oligoflexia bacterium]|nr:SPOR domain-containing protein [Oligoflexia bacterium]HMR25786.1 SPOR domain-containing protein [Oligoflexia bacterium]
MKFTTNKQKVYYIGFPLFVFFLCFISYKIGYQKGIYKVTYNESLETIVDRKVIKRPEKLIFYDELNKELDDKVDSESESLLVKKTPKVVETPKEETPVVRQDELQSKSTLDSSKTTFPDSLVIQLSAFKDKDKAQELVNSLQSKGFLAFLISQEGDQIWHRVFVGPYDNRIKANEGIQKLEQNGFGRGFIVDQPTQ